MVIECRVFSHKDEDWEREWVSLVVLATPCKGESGKLGGRRIGEIIEKAWHTFKSLPEMMHIAVMKV